MSDEKDDALLDSELREALGDERGDLADRIQFGLEVENWLAVNPAAAYLVGRAQDSIEEASTLFLNASELDTPEVKAAHFQAYVGATIIEWVTEAINSGREATKAITSEEDMNYSGDGDG